MECGAMYAGRSLPTFLTDILSPTSSQERRTSMEESSTDIGRAGEGLEIHLKNRRAMNSKTNTSRTFLILSMAKYSFHNSPYAYWSTQGCSSVLLSPYICTTFFYRFGLLSNGLPDYIPRTHYLHGLGFFSL
jgi:hypothetical protein